jgi:hypothetical protein
MILTVVSQLLSVGFLLPGKLKILHFEQVLTAFPQPVSFTFGSQSLVTFSAT